MPHLPTSLFAVVSGIARNIHTIYWSAYIQYISENVMMTPSNWNIFHVTVPWWGESPVTGGFPSQMPVTRSFDVINYLRLNKRLNKRSRHRWFETQTRPLWRHCIDTRNNWNGIEINYENCVRPYLLTCNEILGYVITMNMTYKHFPIHPSWWILKTSWFVLNGKVVQVNNYDK